MLILVFLFGRHILQTLSTSESEEFQFSRIVNRIPNLLFTMTFCAMLFWLNFLQRNLLLDLVDCSDSHTGRNITFWKGRQFTSQTHKDLCFIYKTNIFTQLKHTSKISISSTCFSDYIAKIREYNTKRNDRMNNTKFNLFYIVYSVHYWYWHFGLVS